MDLKKYPFFHSQIFNPNFLSYCLKRDSENYVSNTAQLPRKKPKNGTIKEAQPKNPVAMLNELRPQLTYELASQTGPVHAPIFTISVTVSLFYYITFISILMIIKLNNIIFY